MLRIERRSMKRFNLSLLVDISYMNSEGSQASMKLYYENICGGGAFFKTKKLLPVGTNVDMVLYLPNNKLDSIANGSASVSLSGKVSRLETKGMAIAFNSNFQFKPAHN